MKSIKYIKYGQAEVLSLESVKKPIPKDDEVLIKIYATTVTSADCMMRRGDSLLGRLILGLLRPKKKYQTLGIELSGVVEQVGASVKQFTNDDKIYGFTGFSAGAYAEYKCLSENSSIALKPDKLSFEEAASIVDSSTTALFFLCDKAKMKRGDEILIIGASGSIGSAAVQIAKHYGANVTGVCSDRNIDLVKSLGADYVIDYKQVDYTAQDKKYDIIFDTVGKSSFLASKNSLKSSGKFLVTTGNLAKLIFFNKWTKYFSDKKHINAMSVDKKEALKTLRELVELDAVKAVIDSHYPLERIVEAHQYVEKGHKSGNVVINVVKS